MAIYLDHAATTPLRPEVLALYTDELQQLGNPSSVHGFGQQTRRTLEESRERLAATVGCHRSEVIFTSGGTESDNLAIKGLYWTQQKRDAKRKVIISSATEHHAVIDPIEWLVKHEGAEAVWAPVTFDGVVDLDWLADFLADRGDEVALITLMWANNEVGVLHPIRSVVEMASSHQIPVHSDAVAAFGHVEVDFAGSGLSAMSISGHKIGAPVGVGALIVSRATNIESIIHGGGQERGFRSGTMNAPAAAAFALAAELAVGDLEAESVRLTALRAKLVEGVKAAVPGAELTGGSVDRIPGNAHFTFPGCSGDSLLYLLDASGICVSTGSACQAGVTSASHVVMAMGREPDVAIGSLRITLGYTSCDDDVNAFLAALPAAFEGAQKAGLPGR